MGDWKEYATLLHGKLPNTNVDVYLIEHNEYYGRDGLYGINGKDFIDNPRRFIFLSRAIFEAAKAINFRPDIIHSHDFHTAYSQAFLKCYYKNDPFFNKTAGVFTIHNLAYQGQFPPEDTMLYTGFGMNEFYKGAWHEHNNTTNYMKIGIMFADKITTVSKTYANEIRTEYYGEKLHNILNKRAADLIGILNGVNYDIWNPTTDKVIQNNYNEKTLHIKQNIKKQFLKDNNIHEKDNTPLISIISRMTEQKGFDILIQTLEDYLWNDKIVFAIIGSGDIQYQNYFNYIKNKYPNNTFIYIGYNETLAHNIYAASDFLLIPSRFEPCGLTQMYAMKYATIPIVRATGGLADTVREYNPTNKEGNGFVFWNYDANDLSFAIQRALAIYHTNDIEIIRKNAMAADFSSNISAKKYIECFNWALEKI
jgi:starch synthase